ncbi:MAG TPA: D-alanyl-D-alanine carboxypeptidase/D-alanyl-D-alanine-endopeptidase [Acidimicrobiales bacterium]|nr:D-alanyl-D-alanine carboxypeptidase/D-alanyl-D-alanine-endopeptidase [Acidimicrobiales bacterium]
MRVAGLSLLLAVSALAAGWRASDVGAPSIEPAEVAATAKPVTTPLLSVRRAPVFLQSPVADGALVSGLDTRVTAVSPADTCVVVREGGRVIYTKNEQKSVTPASNHKLLTALAALDVLGAETRLRTTVVSDAPRAGGVVAGSLWLVGGGDPLLSTSAYIDRFAERYGYRAPFTDIGTLADRIATAGVTEIRGDVIGDDRRYDRQRVVPSWPTRLVTQGQVGPISALAVNDGFTSFARDPEVTTLNVASADPAQHAASMLMQELRARNVRVTGVARSGESPAAATEVANIDSPTMREIVAELLTLSDNNTAESLTKEMGLKERNEPTTVAGVATIRAALERRQLPLDGVAFADGSGLDPNDKLTCALVMEILTLVGPTSDIGGKLPIAGTTGTLHDRYTTAPLIGKLRAKTGRLLNVSSMSGYVTTPTDRTLTFAYITNVAADVTLGERGINAQNELASLLVSYPQAPPLDQLSPKPPQG